MSRTSQTATLTDRGSPGVVLVVDDSEANRYAVGTWLRGAGYDVREVDSGQSALDQAVQGADLVVLDVHLPDISGFDVVKRLRDDPRTAHLPVLHVSAVRLETRDRVAGLHAGADAYLTHPIEPAEFLATVSALMRLHRAEHELQRDAARLEQAHAATADLARATTFEEVARVLHAHATSALGAGFAMLYRLGDAVAGEEPSVLHAVGLEHQGALGADLAARRSTVPLHDDTPATEAVRYGDAVWLPTAEKRARRYPHLSQERLAIEFGSWAAVPMLVGGRAIGAIVLAWPHAQPGDAFDEATRTFVRGLADQCAVSAERVRLLAAERAAVSRVSLLQEVTASLAGTFTRDEIARVVVGHLVRALGARMGTLALLTPDGAELELVGGLADAPDARDGESRRPAATSAVPAVAALAADAPLVAWRLDDLRRRFPAAAPAVEACGVESLWHVRLETAGHALGTIELGFARSRVPTRQEAELLAAASHQCAIALERARFAASETRARIRTERLQRLTGALAEARTVHDVVTASAVHAASAFGAVGTVIALLGDDGETLEIVLARAMSDEAHDAWRRFPLASHVPLADVTRTGRPVFLESRAAWREHYPALLPLAEREGHHANVVVPLEANRRVIGAMGMAFDAPRRFDEDDRALAVLVARQCAQVLERARLFEAERAARGEAEAASRAKSEFLAVMSHELRTPLNAIGGYVELLELGIRGPVTPEQLDDLRRIQAAQRHLTGLVTDVLNYVRIETGRVQYVIDDVPLRPVLAALEPLVAPQLAAKRLGYHFTPPDPALRVRADAEKLKQVLLNLLTNALKFTDDGGTISLETDAGASEVRIRVHDTGRGIAAEKLDAIFEPFVQVDKGLTRTSEGVGLGLAISRDLARGMHGDLGVASTLGGGSTFTLTLPRA